jgi:hypothetical protein
VALDRRSAALLLGIVLSGSCNYIGISSVSTKVHWDFLYYWIAAGVLYAFAKVFEFTDEAIYSVGKLLSGHTLKHLAAAATCFAILRYFQPRQPIFRRHPAHPVEAI